MFEVHVEQTLSELAQHFRSVQCLEQGQYLQKPGSFGGCLLLPRSQNTSQKDTKNNKESNFNVGRLFCDLLTLMTVVFVCNDRACSVSCCQRCFLLGSSVSLRFLFCHDKNDSRPAEDAADLEGQVNLQLVLAYVSLLEHASLH